MTRTVPSFLNGSIQGYCDTDNSFNSFSGDQDRVVVTRTTSFKGSAQGYCDMDNFLNSFHRDQDRVIVTRTTCFVLFGSSHLGLP